jgi:hypothetical protein
MADRLYFHPRSFAVAIGLLAVPSAGLSIAAATGGLQARAKETLFRCIERTHLVTLSAIVVQKSGKNCPTDVQVKVEQDKGKRKETILQPLSSQGFWSLNDGKKLVHYNADKEEQMVQPAPPSAKEYLRERMELAGENYRFEIQRNGMIAGRQAWVVTASPKFSEMPARRYSIDIDKDVLLRLETVENGRRDLRYDTQAIWYPDKLDSDVFNFKPVGQFKIITVPGPQKIINASMAKAKVGFAPLIPKDLPFGFIVRDSQLTGKEEARFIAVRITDGLITATIYQWDPRRLGSFGRDLDVRSIRGIRIGLVGDLPDVVHERLLDLFEKEAHKAFGPGPEPPTAPAALKRNHKPRVDGGSDSGGDGTEDDSSQSQVDQALLETVASFLTMLQNSPELQ